eukprot:gb/GECG01010282.1/.p1 GENE.gb/GECG01010282.1/~~gb/GECG01010282.1/.p1  ORF type:complete len:291 (+),score=18.06 gb/GECG01010282.1/:1-873(+)
MEPAVGGTVAFVALFTGYTSLSYTLWKAYFEPSIRHKSKGSKDTSIKQWKNQPNDHSALKEPDEDIIPVIALAKELLRGDTGHHKSDRHPKHNLFATINLFMSCCFAGVTVYCILAEKSRVYFELDSHQSLMYNVLWILGLTIFTVIHESVVEYYWHVMMHTRPCYRRFHKFHHYYTSPAPFDDLFIHPLESFGYQCILWSPPFLYSQHYSVFVLYMAIMGVTGILDHCGIHFEIPNIYNTKDHDIHHEYFNVNFGFPTIYLDVIHGTYLGHYCGRDFVPKYKRMREKDT